MEELVLKFEPKTIEHLDVKIYSTLPPALAELISNSYYKDVSEIKVSFHYKKVSIVSIVVKDNGCSKGFCTKKLNSHNYKGLQMDAMEWQA